ncbi:hypothetical protein [Latilactobacillus graminis]|uniref:Membrane protein n=2 Tax=Latilactobacillus graminis TaxID=60519 RepID=A0AA89I274_9LACO|nr:hypothetical protein [Latilactobacillus graminis]KRM24249.1 membrane protein [Latilactobacillus graminis DSM 20719]QFP78771.1 hypothetical protein LG542_00240 [Latilactobacillus graminis]
MIECTQCHIKYGRQLRQCPNCGLVRHVTRPQRAQPWQQYYQFLAESLKHPLKVRWQWYDAWFGLVTFGLVLLMNTATVSLLIASWSEQVGAVAGVMASQVVLRQRPQLLPVDLKVLGLQVLFLVIIVGSGFLIKHYLLKKTTTTLRAFLTEISAYSSITLVIALGALLAALFFGIVAIWFVLIMAVMMAFSLNIAIGVSLFQSRGARFDRTYAILLFEIVTHVVLVVVIGQIVILNGLIRL